MDALTMKIEELANDTRKNIQNSTSKRESWKKNVQQVEDKNERVNNDGHDEEEMELRTV